MDSQANNNLSPSQQRLHNLKELFTGDNFKAQLHYYIFEASQALKQKNAQASKYNQRLTFYWQKWLGIGAAIAGVLMFLSPDTMLIWQLPLIALFVLLAPLFSDWAYAFKTAISEPPGKRFIGQVVTLTNPIVDGKTTIRLNNQNWSLSGQDCPAGSQVKIIGVNGRMLYSTPVAP